MMGVQEGEKIFIDKVPAGREMDVLVAEKVFGFTVMYDEANSRWGVEIPPGTLRRGGLVPIEEKRYFPLLPYSTDDTTALGMLKRLPYAFQIYREDTRECITGKHSMYSVWRVHIGYQGGIISVWAGAETLSLAICHAALRVFEEANND